jgi:hypothetical protein
MFISGFEICIIGGKRTESNISAFAVQPNTCLQKGVLHRNPEEWPLLVEFGADGLFWIERHETLDS